MKSLLFWIAAVFILYLYIDRRSKLKKCVDTLPTEIKYNSNSKKYIEFYYGSSLSNHWSFMTCLEIDLPMRFLNSQVSIHYHESILKPYLLTNHFNKLKVWAEINDCCHIAKSEQLKIY